MTSSTVDGASAMLYSSPLFPFPIQDAPCSLRQTGTRRTGMMPILDSPGLMMPGQLGPISRVLLCSLSTFLTFTMLHSRVEGVRVRGRDSDVRCSCCWRQLQSC